MRLLFDHNMPVSAADAFRENGHEVIFLKDVLPPDSKDPIVAATAEINEAVLVTFDRDFKKMASRISRGQARRFRNLSKMGAVIHPQGQPPSRAGRGRAMRWSAKCLKPACGFRKLCHLLSLNSKLRKRLETSECICRLAMPCPRRRRPAAGLTFAPIGAKILTPLRCLTAILKCVRTNPLGD